MSLKYKERTTNESEKQGMENGMGAIANVVYKRIASLIADEHGRSRTVWEPTRRCRFSNNACVHMEPARSSLLLIAVLIPLM